MQPAQADVGAATPVVIGQFVGTEGRCDIDLDHHQVGVIFKIERLHMFILEDDLVGR